MTGGGSGASVTDYYRHVACDRRINTKSSTFVRFESIRGNGAGTISWRLRQPALTLYWWRRGFSGCRVDVAGERVAKQAAGDLGIALVPPGASSFGEFDIPGPCGYEVAFLEPPLLEQVDIAYGEVPLVCLADDPLQSGMRELAAWRHDATFGLMADGWALQAVGRIGRVLGRARPKAAQALGKRQVGLVETFVAENLNQSLGVAELAAVTGLPAADFASAFRRATGMTLAGYVRTRRMEAARRLLTTTGSCDGEIALLTGFSDVEGFGRSFREWEGISPAEFRRQRC